MRASTMPKPMVSATESTTIAIGMAPRAVICAERDAHAEQRNADAQQRARGELDARYASPVGREEVQRHAEQQGKEHRRHMVVLGQRDGGDRHHHGHQDAVEVRASGRAPA